MSFAQERFPLQWGLDLCHEPGRGEANFISLNPIWWAQKAVNEQPVSLESSISLSKSSYQIGPKTASKGPGRLTNEAS